MKNYSHDSIPFTRSNTTQTQQNQYFREFLTIRKPASANAQC